MTLMILSGLPAGLRAQEHHGPILPSDVPSFEFPLASSRTSAMVGRIVHVSRGESKFGSEWEAEPALGELWPLVAISRGRIPLTLHLGTEVSGRFSLADKGSALISNDWHVNAILTATARRWHLALEGYHESSHLGDEYRDRFAVSRVNWSREILGLWGGYSIGGLDLRGNASYAAIDALNLSRGGFALAADWRGRRRSNGLSPLAGLQVDAQGYTGWNATWGARAGIRLGDPGASRGMALMVSWMDGMSPQRQFYGSRTRYVGMEVRFDL